MSVSVIIPTLNRSERIKKLILSLLENTDPPKEILIVEQGDSDKLKKIIKEIKTEISIFVVPQSIKSAAAARNKGAYLATQEYLLFLDDDMQVGYNYIEIAVSYLKSKKDIKLVFGSYSKDEPKWTVKKILGAFFCIYSTKAKNVVLSSGSYDYIRGDNLNIEQFTEWAPTSNLMVRRNIFKEFKFNENFERWSFGEDVMFTYKIYKKYPSSILYIPQLNVVHDEGTESKMLPVEIVRMKIIYRYIFWKSEIYSNDFLQILCYLWSQIGLLILTCFNKPSITVFKIQIQTFWFLYKNKEKIVDNKIDYNKYIFS